MAKKSGRVASGRVVSRRVSPKKIKSPEERDTLESKIWSFAKRGKLRDAAASAVRAQFDAGLSIVYQAGQEIVREGPDGRREVLHAAPAPAPVPARFRSFIVGTKKGRS